jgi:plastocyanin
MQQGQQSAPAENKPTNQPSQNTQPSVEGIAIVFTDKGFEKSSYTVKAGQTVTVKNQSSSLQVQFSSDDHPTHTKNPELNMDILSPGEEDTITPQHVGSWGIHDHQHPEFTTTLVVTQ